MNVLVIFEWFLKISNSLKAMPFIGHASIIYYSIFDVVYVCGLRDSEDSLTIAVYQNLSLQLQFSSNFAWILTMVRASSKVKHPFLTTKCIGHIGLTPIFL